MFYLIDGYNLVLASGLARTLDGPGNLARARSSLLGWLASRLSEIEQARTTIVFDAKPYTVDKKELAVGKMRVLFAVDYPDADSLLEELISQHSAPKRLIVVSSDQRIQAAAKRRRARPVTSQDWHEQIEQRSRNPASSTTTEEKPPPGNSSQFVSEFDTPEIQQLIEDDARPLRRPPNRRRKRS